MRLRPYTVKMRPRIRCRITVPKITRKYGPFTALMKQIHGENTDSRIDWPGYRRYIDIRPFIRS
jgi:hypothetical protein